MLANTSLTASHVSADVLLVTLTITNWSARIKNLEDTQHVTILPTLGTLTMPCTFLNTCCINVSAICVDLNISVINISGGERTLNTSLVNVSPTLDSVVSHNGSFKTAF